METTNRMEAFCGILTPVCKFSDVSVHPDVADILGCGFFEWQVNNWPCGSTQGRHPHHIQVVG
jgi:hypothetical protein